MKGGDTLNIFGWIREFFGNEKSIKLTQRRIASQEVKLAIEEFAIFSAISLIAGAVSKCEFKTYLKGKETKKREYYQWNIEPNKNQNSSQFIQELITKLLYLNECLIFEVNGQLIIADSFVRNENGIQEDTFTDVIKGKKPIERTFLMRDVLYFKYFNEDVRFLLSNLMSGYNDLINMAVGKYKRAGGRKGIVNINTTAKGNKEDKNSVDDLFNRRFKNYFESENAVLHLPKGVDYEENNSEGNKKSASEVNDISIMLKEAFERAAQAYKIPPSILRGDIADIGKLTDNLLTFCVDPLTDMISEEITRKRYGEKAFIEGSRLEVDTKCIKHIDLFSIAQAYDKLIASGGYSIDELRVKAGDVELGTWWSQKHWMTKNYTDIENIESMKEGGEDQ